MIQATKPEVLQKTLFKHLSSWQHWLPISQWNFQTTLTWLLVTIIDGIHQWMQNSEILLAMFWPNSPEIWPRSQICWPSGQERLNAFQLRNVCLLHSEIYTVTHTETITFRLFSNFDRTLIVDGIDNNEEHNEASGEDSAESSTWSDNPLIKTS